MKDIKEYINESNTNVNIKDILTRYKEANDLDSNKEEDMNKLNILAMDALELYWHDKNFDKKVNDEIYDLYKKSWSLWLNKQNEEAKKSFINVISQVLNQF